MKAFAQLYSELDRTTKTGRRVEALERYFRSVAPEDAAWALFFLSGRRFPRAVTGMQLRAWIAEAAKLSSWLVAECHEAAGDLGETIALLHPANGEGTDLTLSEFVRTRLAPLAELADADKRISVLETWAMLDAPQRLLFNKLISGTFRVGVGSALVARAVARAAAVDPAVMAHRLMGNWSPSADGFRAITAGTGATAATPYPFFLASPLEEEPEALGAIEQWQLEWKWDGIRAQLLRRNGETFLWTRGEELVSERYPEILAAAKFLPDGTVLDGELLAWKNDAPMSFSALQRRIGKRSPGARLLREIPVVFIAYDLPEASGGDFRGASLAARRERLEAIVARARSVSLMVSPVLVPAGWGAARALRAEARKRGVEGLMLKRRGGAYGVGRTKGEWWKWKIDPLTVEAVLVAAQSGHGRRASLFTDYTFAIWNDGALVPVAKAYSGLTDVEIRELDKWIRAHTNGRHGPVRTVEPELVFELAFDSLQESTRHRAGIALRFPRILRRRDDKRPADADTVDSLRALLRPTAPPAKESEQLDLLGGED